jgi:hypothetical protein
MRDFWVQAAVGLLFGLFLAVAVWIAQRRRK